MFIYIFIEKPCIDARRVFKNKFEIIKGNDEVINVELKDVIIN